MLNIILSIKRTQVHCTQILSSLFTCPHVMINTDLVPTEKQVLEKMTPSTSILSLQLASEHLAMLNDKAK